MFRISKRLEYEWGKLLTGEGDFGRGKGGGDRGWDDDEDGDWGELFSRISSSYSGEKLHGSGSSFPILCTRIDHKSSSLTIWFQVLKAPFLSTLRVIFLISFK